MPHWCHWIADLIICSSRVEHSQASELVANTSEVEIADTGWPHYSSNRDHLSLLLLVCLPLFFEMQIFAFFVATYEWMDWMFNQMKSKQTSSKLTFSPIPISQFNFCFLWFLAASWSFETFPLSIESGLIPLFKCDLCLSQSTQPQLVITPTSSAFHCAVTFGVLDRH